MLLENRLVRLLIVIPLLVYGALFVLALFSDRLIFQPQKSSYRDGPNILKLKSDDKTISAVHLSDPQARYTLLFSHGNAEDLGDDMPLLEEFRKLGFSVFSYDYRGYGTSEGVSSEKTVYEDVNAAYEYLTKQLNVPPEQIISMGRSLGSAAAIELAANRPVGGLIIETPFLTAYRVLTRVPLFPFDKFRNIDKIRRVRSPVLVIHGRADRVIPLWHGQRIYALANEPKRYLWIDGADHNDVFLVAGEQYLNAVKEFGNWLGELQQRQIPRAARDDNSIGNRSHN